ncbi:TetR/AcrR family transcriptional regulator [Photobacterium gaetbulicola]|uniref:Transcriptional regulator n=1 Tax=Photobacterium gaetbulicola Gung47 TaxID=658445 RepID=A0A0C5WP01_9GAMM|nr:MULTISPECIES: TetR/AcrR family transcriptional regulator [Photobacterium]AJR06759.1 transcriptional regulator [Photobacterium gaetbulicola Gung47]PSU14073.1 TetR/AcrR family transcriptional regulator [Photobacterium gaetbulicola]WEM44808.1 TetR/AcrR family transcriptional regulator [Photobacterium sp. DA100]
MGKVAEIKQENIVCAALEIFSEKGLELASMEAISKKAEVSKRTLYKYYPTKESLFEVIVERLVSNVKVISSIPFQPDQSITDQLTHIAQKEVELLCSPSFMAVARVVMAECIRSKELASLMVEKFQPLDACHGLTRWILDGIDAGKLNVAHPEIASEQFVSCLKATIFWPQIMAHQPAPDPTILQATIESAVQQFTAAYEIKSD